MQNIKTSKMNTAQSFITHHQLSISFESTKSVLVEGPFEIHSFSEI